MTSPFSSRPLGVGHSNAIQIDDGLQMPQR
jgi:hypothetical protein